MEDCLYGVLGKEGKIPLMEELLKRDDEPQKVDWLFAILIMTIMFQPNAGPEYWRGKYEALKEIYDARIGYSDIKIDLERKERE